MGQVHSLTVSFQGPGRKLIHQVLSFKDRMAIKGLSITRDKGNPLCIEGLTEPVRVQVPKKVGVIPEQIVVIPMFHRRRIRSDVP
jgi:hypothetical protein